ncbi:hypothetical protein APR04_001178 [Promicromonospora umidemergens]|uniref:Uncharacterized protein n=1 Tax=Promicromonospora umidemergens TaxID=629679 RepID=A0ABP8YDT0_9MICO|nr:hypothetical protein [Promicromonospora umidemergens]MCP2282283.1 hypothetical protein [Promicromonospora umidemergens]
MQRVRRYLDPVLVAGVLFSVVVSVVLDVSGLATGAEPLIVGLVGTAITLVLESIVLAERRFRWRERFARAPELESRMEQVADWLIEVSERYPGSQVEAEAQRRVDRLLQDVEELASGRMRFPGSDYRLIVRATREAKSTMWAITNLRTHTGEQAFVGPKYWEENRRAVQRGVRVARVFAYDEMTDQTRDLVAQHEQAGIQVHTVRNDRVPSEASMSLVVWDDAVGWEAQLNADGEVVENRFTVRPDDVRRLVGLFRRCVDAGDPPEARTV